MKKKELEKKVSKLEKQLEESFIENEKLRHVINSVLVLLEDKYGIEIKIKEYDGAYMMSTFDEVSDAMNSRLKKKIETKKKIR